MRVITWLGVMLICAYSVTARAAESKDKKKEKQGDAAGAVTGPDSAGEEPGKTKDKQKDKSDKKDKSEKESAKAESSTAKAERDAAEAKEAGGDESELGTLAQQLGLSDTQKDEIGKEFERYRARLAQIKALPDKSPNEKLLKGPQRRALRDDLAKWVTAHVSPGQAQKFDAYEKKRTKDLFDEHVNSRVTKLTDKLHLNDNQQAKVREIYDAQLRGVQNAADEMYTASRKTGASVGDIEKSLEARRDAMKKAIEGVLKPEQIEQYKKMED